MQIQINQMQMNMDLQMAQILMLQQQVAIMNNHLRTSSSPVFDPRSFEPKTLEPRNPSPELVPPYQPTSAFHKIMFKPVAIKETAKEEKHVDETASERLVKSLGGIGGKSPVMSQIIAEETPKLEDVEQARRDRRRIKINCFVDSIRKLSRECVCDDGTKRYLVHGGQVPKYIWPLNDDGNEFLGLVFLWPPLPRTAPYSHVPSHAPSYLTFLPNRLRALAEKLKISVYQGKGPEMYLNLSSQ